MAGDEFTRWRRERERNAAQSFAYPVIDAEPIDDAPDNDNERSPWPGFKVGVLVGLLVGFWCGFLSHLVARAWS